MTASINPLNKYSSYTYHFALLVDSSIDRIQAIKQFPADGTKRYSGVDADGSTLLINSVKDAHQIIDNVSFTYINSFVNTGTPLVPCGELNMSVIEPGDCMFLHKLKLAMSKHQMSKPTFAVFGLLIKFVGQKPDGTADTYTDIPIIPMVLVDMKASFDHRGGVYSMKFVMASTSGATSQASQGHTLLLSTGPQGVIIKANKLSEALDQLKEKLQKNYDQTIAIENPANGPRKLQYNIEYPRELFAGFNVKSSIMDNSGPGSKYSIPIPANMQISEAIRSIIMHSQEANDYVGSSQASFKKQLHAGAKMWTIMPEQQPKDGVVVMNYVVKEYVGDNNEKFEFDFYFSATPNTDVISYEVMFSQSTIFYLSDKSDFGYAASLNPNPSDAISKSTPIVNNIHKNEKQSSQIVTPTPSPVVGLTNDIIPAQGSPSMHVKGYASVPISDVPARKEAMMAMAKAMSADYAQKMLTIRGTPLLLKSCIGHTGGSVIPFGVTGGIWIKVNIATRDVQGMNRGELIPYFYTGWYHLISVQSTFNAGKFEQELTLVMMPDVISGEEGAAAAQLTAAFNAGLI